MPTGIYTITNTINGKMYIGLATNIISRFSQHKYFLIKGTHDNSKLQRAWNKYGKDSFIFEELVRCEVEHLASEEHYWCNILDVHNPEKGYNIRPTHPYNNPKVADITKKKLSVINKNQDNSCMRKPIVQLDCNGNFMREWESITQASLNTGIGDSCISHCCSGRRNRAGEFIWVFKDKYVGPIIPKPIKSFRKVEQYTVNGIFIQSFKNTREAARKIGCEYSSIPTAIKNNKTCRGFIWKYTEKDPKIYKNGKKSATNTRKVFCSTLNKMYDTIKEASEDLKIPACGIVAVCRKLYTHSHNYKFNYVEIH